MADDGSNHGGGAATATPSESNFDFEREKLVLERERLSLERERLENERLRHRQTVEISNGAAGRVVLPASTFLLSLLVALMVGGAIGAWIVAANYRSSSASIAESIARAIGSQPFDEDDPDGTNSTERVGGLLLRSSGRLVPGSGYLLILD